MTSKRTQRGPGDTTSPGRAYIIHPVLASQKPAKAFRDIDDIVEEAQGLALAINIEVLGTRICKVAKPSAGYLLGKGTRTDIGQEITELKPDVVIINHTLSPVQQRNLEKEWQAKVIDRTGLILEIFGARAQTREGRIQVQLAALEYQRSRVVRAWTHLERQRGGTGKTGGPGERQIELDRRMIGEKIIRLKKELEDVRRTRELGRKSRERVPYPIVALVGYTNAGKSTLFNRLTGAKIFAEDLLFATLDPTLRQVTLKNGQEIILSDTVGFISDLPTHLIAAFRATLEQVLYADVIVHVVDVSRPDYQAQRQDVISILEDLGIAYEQDGRIVEAYNKIDKVGDADLQELQRKARFIPNQALLSAHTGVGVQELLSKVEDILAALKNTVAFLLDSSDGRGLAWLYRHGQISKREDREKGVYVEVSIDSGKADKFQEQYGYKPKKIKTAS